MKKIYVITPSQQHFQEWDIIHALFQCGLETLHVRKPSFSETELMDYLHKIDVRFHSRIMIHQHFSVLQHFGLKGIHLRESVRAEEKEKWIALRKQMLVSTSVHSLHDLIQEAASFDYLFISKLFDSISKKEETKSIALEQLQETIISKSIHNAVGLGGISETNLPFLENSDLSGIALLGAIWESTTPVETFQNIQQRIL